jgi:hypothetical protein
MIINDLNYLETSNEEVFGGILLGVLSSNASVYLNVVECLDIDKKFVSNVSTSGRIATAEAEIVGFNNGAAQAFTTIATGYIAATSISAV